MSKLGSLYIRLGEPEGDMGGCCEIADWAADEIERLRKETEKLIPAPVVDWVRTNSPDPRHAYTTRINEHIVGIHGSEEAARNHAWTIETYFRMSCVPKARGES